MQAWYCWALPKAHRRELGFFIKVGPKASVPPYRGLPKRLVRRGDSDGRSGRGELALGGAYRPRCWVGELAPRESTGVFSSAGEGEWAFITGDCGFHSQRGSNHSNSSTISSGPEAWPWPSDCDECCVG